MEDSTQRSYEPHVMQRIEPLLERYFAGEVETNGSNFGSMIERMKLYGLVAFPCLEQGCHGGFTEDGKDCRRCKGTGFRPDTFNNRGELTDFGAVHLSSLPARDFCSTRCPDCQGGGTTETDPSTTGNVKLKKAERAKIFGSLFAARKRVSYRTIKRIYSGRRSSQRAYQLVCEAAAQWKLPDPPSLNTQPITVTKCLRCDGSGSVVPIDALNGPGDRSEAGYRMRESEMEFQATVNRVLRLVMKRSPLAHVVLNAYHGQIGDHWATYDAGRIFALWPLTIPGRELVESYEGKAETPHDMLLEQTQRQKEDPQTHRATLIRQAGESARTLLATARKELAIADRDSGGRLASMAMKTRIERVEPQLAVTA